MLVSAALTPVQYSSNSPQNGEGSIWSSFEPLTMNHLGGSTMDRLNIQSTGNLPYLTNYASPETLNGTVGFLRAL